MYTKGPYTPPGVDGTMVTFPSTLGGGNWNGFSYDPTLGLAFTSVMNLGQVAKMVQGTARGGGPPTWVRRSPWGGAVGRFWNPGDEDSVLGAAVRRARRGRREPRRGRVEGAARVHRIAQGARASTRPAR